MEKLALIVVFTFIRHNESHPLQDIPKETRIVISEDQELLQQVSDGPQVESPAQPFPITCLANVLDFIPSPVQHRQSLGIFLSRSGYVHRRNP